MDDGGHRENGRHKVDQYKTAQGQWLVQTQPSMKQILAIMSERDAAIHERNIALSEKKAAIAERDMAFLQRDSAISERNNALIERDNAIATFQYRKNPHPNVHHPRQHANDASYPTRETPTNEAVPISPIDSQAPKPRRGKRPKDGDGDGNGNAKATPPNKKKSERKVKRENKDLNSTLGGSEPKCDWKSQDLGVNGIAFDESTMAAPVCSCTGTYRQCYKWGNGGWQSSCCTTTLSAYPLPAVPNKRHARIGGRKMSGSAYSKLLSRLAAEGYDLSNPVDLKENWAKHGTNRYITIK